MDTIDFKEFRDDMKQVLAIVGKKYGIALDIGNISYDRHGGFTTKLTAVSKALVGNLPDNVNPAWIKDYTSRCMYHDLRQSDLNTTVKYKGQDYLLVGLRSKARHKLVLMSNSGKFLAVNRSAITLARDSALKAA